MTAERWGLGPVTGVNHDHEIEEILRFENTCIHYVEAQSDNLCLSTLSRQKIIQRRG